MKRLIFTFTKVADPEMVQAYGESVDAATIAAFMLDTHSFDYWRQKLRGGPDDVILWTARFAKNTDAQEWLQSREGVPALMEFSQAVNAWIQTRESPDRVAYEEAMRIIEKTIL